MKLSRLFTQKIILGLLLVAAIIYSALALYFTDKVYFICPIKYNRDIVVRSDGMGDGYFSSRRGNGSRTHEGVDLYAPIGTAVLAPRSGWVREAAASPKGIGMYIVIKHAGNMITRYGHLSEILVRQGQYVRQGDLIGRVGKTGNANYRDMQPHLHLEVRREGILQDPLSFLE